MWRKCNVPSSVSFFFLHMSFRLVKLVLSCNTLKKIVSALWKSLQMDNYNNYTQELLFHWKPQEWLIQWSMHHWIYTLTITYTKGWFFQPPSQLNIVYLYRQWIDAICFKNFPSTNFFFFALCCFISNLQCILWKWRHASSQVISFTTPSVSCSTGLLITWTHCWKMQQGLDIQNLWSLWKMLMA